MWDNVRFFLDTIERIRLENFDNEIHEIVSIFSNQIVLFSIPTSEEQIEHRGPIASLTNQNQDLFSRFPSAHNFVQRIQL